MNSSCRLCQSTLALTFANLGVSPLANAFIQRENSLKPELFYPLHAQVCTQCWLVQVGEFIPPSGIFNDYAYFSSFSESWVTHARDYTSRMIQDLALNEQSQVVEIASNDGYLLQHFLSSGIPVLGIEPADNVANVARKKGIETWSQFFGKQTADTIVLKNLQADLLIANNVLAHVPDLHDFIAGLKRVLKPTGILTLEFPHLVRLVEGRQFDTIYHEHFSYFSLNVVNEALGSHGLTIFDVEQLATHGGSLRVFARHSENRSGKPTVRPGVETVLAQEVETGIKTPQYYQAFSEQVCALKREILSFLIREKQAGRHLVGYGAPAKGNTLLNYCGIGTDFLDYTVDLNPHKQGTLLPGSRIPVFSPEKMLETKPDLIIILPWNLRTEIQEQICQLKLQHPELNDWEPQLATFVPEIDVFDLQIKAQIASI